MTPEFVPVLLTTQDGCEQGLGASSDGTKGMVLIYTHRGSVPGALLSGMAFHFWTLHWQML